MIIYHWKHLKRKKNLKEKYKRAKFEIYNILILNAISNSYPFSHNFSYLLGTWHSLHHMLDQILQKKYSGNTNIFK
jgi:hypothetical protein